jgi:hypothetical protein
MTARNCSGEEGGHLGTGGRGLDDQKSSGFLPGASV